MNTSKYHPLPIKTFETLAANHALHCVSIYVPMHKKGKEQNEHLAQEVLKKCIKDVHKTLQKYQLSDPEIIAYLKPIEALITDIELWRNPSEGLAIFLNKKGLNYYTLPIPFIAKTQVASSFYLTPLLPLFQEEEIYYLLELSQDYVKLYEASAFGLTNLHIKSLAPDTLEKAVGFDFKQKMLQFRSGQDAFSTGSFHGHGEGKDDDQKEILNFLNIIDKAVNQAITNKKAPLIIASTNNVFNTYKQVNTYPNLYAKNCKGDPEFKNKTDLHEASLKLIKPYFEATKKQQLTQFQELYHTPKTSYQINEIIPAALSGKIDTLFVEKNSDEFGLYNIENGKLLLDTKKEIQNSSLTNLAAVQTFLNKGNVFMLDPEEMPVKGRPLNAIFRY
ncbi:hypothetical protein SAMN06265371_10916 [Lutibacter agarilyticus]|uniref:Uncharacterized protein n=1 Tax=Lutibacter agarilyticus TaxID=1109740 RepID=A0A238YGU6_9FLAO|nr:hypothetical protein [Lutibacter agarilyticus]SNR69599.1 hypothetical protein SAMN06265371_10916 [Lutibacter agarilyticus]